ncbi:MAG: hypothetical protein HZC41_18295 [Chloroflexi bacterium]|nr:hypothetical protein [Chloroflexota bacterium]
MSLATRHVLNRLLRLSGILLHPPATVLELAALALLWLLYLSQVVPSFLYPYQDRLDAAVLAQAWLTPTFRQPGVEHERLAGTLVPVQIGLERYSHIPAWNPYLSSGQPTINNPFSYLFNPVFSLPVLLFGGVQGSKLAMALALLIAALSMWALMRATGVGGVGRVTAGALYMMSGGIAGKFYTGHFQLGLSLAWVPLVFAGLWWTLRSRDRRAPVLMAAAFALLYTSGNIYYSLHTLISCLALFAAHLTGREYGRWHVQWWRVRRVALGAGFAVGLAALQFVPVLATAGFIIHDGDPALLTRYSLAQAAVNLIYPWELWRPAFDEVPPFNLFVVVDYNYIGLAPFLLIGAAAVALLVVRLRPIYRQMPWLALLLAVGMMIWGAGQTIIVQELYANVALLAQFRYVGRALAIAALWWIVLASIAADSLWRAARDLLRLPPTFDRYDRARLTRMLLLAVLVWSYLGLYSLGNNSARLRLALGSFDLFRRLDTLRFVTFTDVANGFWSLLLAALVVDTLLLALARFGAWTQARRFGWRGVGVRGARGLVLGVILLALADILSVNSQLLPLHPLLGSFQPLYDTVREADPDTPYPMIQEPHLPMAFDPYYAEMRNWGLTEGWRAGATPGIIPAEAGALNDLPRWAIVSNVYGGASRAFAETFVQQQGYEQRQCITLQPQPASVNPCDVSVEAPYVAVLYEKPDVLPYAFIAPADVLTTAPGTLHRDNVLPVRSLVHQQDTILIEAEKPEDDGDYYLVVRETHFPGWLAFADGLPVESTTLATRQDAARYEGFIGVRLLPGAHTYTLRFQPPGLAAGFVIFLATVVFVVFYLLGNHKPPSRQEHQD